MAVDCFPAELINVTDLRITRPTSTGSWGDTDTTVATNAVLNGAEAIVERREDLVRISDEEEVTIVADIWIRPPADDDQARVQKKDLATWSDFYGTVTEGEVVSVIPAQVGADTRMGVRLRIGKR